MTRLKDATFESNAITGTDAFTSAVGSPTVDGTSLMRGTYCARTNWTASANVNGVVSGLSASEIYISFYIRVASLPAATSRVVQSSNGSTQFNITMTSAGAMTLRNNTTNLAANFLTVSTNTTYRIGIRFKKETTLGAADGIIELYHATGDTAFGTADYTSTTYSMNTSANAISSLSFGQSNGAAATGDIYWDSIRIDDTSMPSPDGGTNTNKAVDITVNNTLTILKNVGMPRTFAVTGTVNKLANIDKPINIAATATVSILRAVNKIISITATISSVIQKNILKPIAIVESVSISVRKGIGKTFSFSSTVNVVSIVGRGYFRTISITVTSLVSAQKTVAKSVVTSITVTSTVQRVLSLSRVISIAVTGIPDIQRSISLIKSITSAVTLIISKIKSGHSNNIYMVKNVGSITLGFRNSIARLFGKNTRTITYIGIDNDNN